MGDQIKHHGEVISEDIRSKISGRYHSITKAVNREFWNSSSDVSHSLYVGSYGRNTAIDTSDIDILVELPGDLFDRVNNLSGNAQSRLLQIVKKAILETYPRSNIRADGQIVKVSFWDGIEFEILPAFTRLNGSYQYPDSNTGGCWKSTNPKAEQNAMADANRSSNGLLYDTCKHMRYIRDNYFASYHLSGIVIDSFAYAAIGNWRWPDEQGESSRPAGEYERALLDHFHQNSIRYGDLYWLQAVGISLRQRPVMSA